MGVKNFNYSSEMEELLGTITYMSEFIEKIKNDLKDAEDIGVIDSKEFIKMARRIFYKISEYNKAAEDTCMNYFEQLQTYDEI